MNTRENPVVKGQEIHVVYSFSNGLHFYQDLGYGEKKDVFHSGFEDAKKMKVFQVNGESVEIIDESNGAIFVRDAWDYFENEEDAKEEAKFRNVQLIDALIEDARKLGIQV